MELTTFNKAMDILGDARIAMISFIKEAVDELGGKAGLDELILVHTYENEVITLYAHGIFKNEDNEYVVGVSWFDEDGLDSANEYLFSLTANELYDIMWRLRANISK